MATQQCPCGYQGHPRVACRCPPTIVERYLRRISGPLLDRIELRVEVAPPTLDELAPQDGVADSSPRGRDLRVQVERAASLARDRQGERANAALDAAELDHFAPLDARGRALLERAARARGLSARALSALRRVARTLADLDGEPRVSSDHLARALGLRAWTR